MHVGPSLLSADQKYPEPLQQQQQYQTVVGGYASLPPNANLSLVTGIPMESPVGSAGNPYYTSLLMLRPPSGSPHTDPSTRKVFHHHQLSVQRLTKRLVRGCENFLPAVA